MLRHVCWFAFLVSLATSISAQQTIYWKKDHIYNGPGGKEIATVTPAPSDQTAPNAPSGLSYSSLTATSVQLSWSAASDSGGSGLAGYKVYRQFAINAPLPVGTVSSGTLTFNDVHLKASTSYTYTIRAFDNAQNHSAASNSVTFATTSGAGETTAPSPPLQLKGKVLGPYNVQLNWLSATDTGGSGLVSYRIQRAGNTIATIAASNLSYVDNSALQNTNQTYVVLAIDGANNISSPSNSVAVTTPPETIPPSTPTNLGGTGLSTSSLRVTWTASTDTGGSGLAGYKVYRAGNLISGGNPISSTSFDDTGLSASTSYSYTVTAVDNVGNTSSAAGPVSISTLAPFQTILFQDNFNREDEQGLGGNWNNSFQWLISSNRAQRPWNYTGWLDTWNNAETAIYRISVVVNGQFYTEGGLLFGIRDDITGRFRAVVNNNTGQLRLSSTHGGYDQTLATAYGIPVGAYELMVEADSNTGEIKVYYDGTLRISYSFYYPTWLYGKSGLTGYGSGYNLYFDDFVFRQY